MTFIQRHWEWYLVCIWIAIKIINYFTIQFIFAIIYGSHCIFLILFMSFIVLFQLIFIFIYITFSNKFLISIK